MKKRNLVLAILAASLLLTTTVFAQDFRNFGFSMMNSPNSMMNQQYSNNMNNFNQDNYGYSGNNNNFGYNQNGRRCH